MPPELGCDGFGAAVPPLFGSAPPPDPLLPPPPPLRPPLLGVLPPPDDGVEPPPDEGGEELPPEEGAGELGVPPVEPPPVDVPPEAFFFFLFLAASPGTTGVPAVTGGTIGCVVWVLELELELPPLDATAITTIRKNANTTAAMSLRRR